MAKNEKPRNKVIPHSSEAETYVLGSLLIEPNLANEFCSRLIDDDFHDPINKKIYSAIDKLFRQRKEVNLINVIEALKGMNQLEDGDESYLFSLIDSVPTIVTTESYVNVLKDKALERELFYAIQDISDKILTDEDEINNLLSKTEKDLMAIVNKQRTGDLTLISNLIPKVFNIIENNRQNSENGVIGLDTGFEKLNELTFGFQPGELIILAARPSVGKSALALNIAYKMCREHDKHVAFFSLEMGVEQMLMRLLSIASNVGLAKIRSGDTTPDEMNMLLNARTEIDELNLYIDQTASNSLEDIKIKCRKLKRNGKLDFIVIDYLQLLSASSGRSKLSRYEEVSTISRGLKLLALELEVPVLALSQLSRAVETRKEQEGDNKVAAKPQLSDLRESGNIEQDADIVLFLHRDRVQDDPTKRQSSFKVEAIIAKNRQGTTGSFYLLFRGDKASFESYHNKKDNDILD